MRRFSREISKWEDNVKGEREIEDGVAMTFKCMGKKTIQKCEKCNVSFDL